MADGVGQLHDDVVHDVEHHHFQEVSLFKGLGKDDLVRHFTILVAVLLHHFLLSGQQVILSSAVQDKDTKFIVFYLPVKILDVSDFNDVRSEYLDVVITS